MTVNYNIRDLDRRYRLPFGVPIEDIFPHDDIHPHLKATFIRAYQDITSSHRSISDILEKFQGTVGQRLEVKNAMSECRQMPIVVPPGVLLWVIRHFLGLLPTPLLPTYADEKYFSWHHLAKFCKKTFLQYRIVDINNSLLTAKIAKDLLRLPPSNLLLFAVLVHFVRLVTSNRDFKKRLHKLSAYYMVRYFSSSLFLRPYIPGRISKLDKQYFPLLLYIVLRWPEIEALFKHKSKLITSPEFEIPEELLNTKRIYALITKQYVNVATQTDNISRYLLDTISEASCENFEYLKDVGVQTPHFEEKTKCCCDVGTSYDTDVSSIFSEELSLSNLCHTQSSASLKNFDDKFADVSRQETVDPKEVGCNTEYSIPITFKLSKATNCLNPNKIDRSTNTDLPAQYGWITPRINPNGASPETIIVSEEGYIYDSYDNSTLNLLCPTKSQEMKDNNELLKRISKIGWTYTPPKSGTMIQLSEEDAGNNSKLENASHYGSKVLLDVDVKESTSEKTTPKNGGSQETINSAKVKRSSFSVASIKSKLDFLKKFSTKRNKLKTSNSLDEVSKIKYKKMTSKKSTTF